MSDAAARFCTKCGAPFGGDVAFCTKCGAARSGEAAATPGPASGASAGAAASARQAVARVSRVAGVAGGAVRAATTAASLPWQTIVTGNPVDVRGLAAAAAPSLLAVAPRPNLRRPAAAILFALFMDLGVTVLSGGAVNVWMLGMRIASGAGTSVLGFVTGRRGGSLRTLTAVASIVLAGVQLLSLLVAAVQAIATPITLLSLLPSIVAVLAGLALSMTTAIAGFRK